VLNEVDLDATWSGRIDQGEFLADRSGYPWRAEQANYDLYLPGFRVRFGNVILSRLPIRNARVVRYATPSRWESMAFGQKDGLLCEVDAGGSLVRVLAVHLESRSESTRLATLPVLRGLLENAATPLILAGDFNSVIQDVDRPRTALDALLHGSTLHRAAGDFGSSFPSDAPEILIDHVLAQPPMRVTRFGVIDSQLSDHRPVWAEVRVER
jgi:endonuclease/exonuclease/phosphatase family metal-dependent hydrolase